MGSRFTGGIKVAKQLIFSETVQMALMYSQGSFKVAERAEAIYWSFSGNYTFLINLKLANPGVITIQLLYSVIKCPLVLTRRGLYVQCLSLLVFSQSCGWQIDNRLHLSFLN